MLKKKGLFFVLPLLCLMLVVSMTIGFVLTQHKLTRASGPTFPYVSGTQLIDASGQSFVLRGAQIESTFAYNGWTTNNDVTRKFTNAVFTQMSSNWHLNAVRIPLSNWVYAKYTKQYLTLLDQVVTMANSYGIYPILDLHDYAQGGSPYGMGASVPKPESVAFWKAIATHYKNNTMVMFDLFNEPQFPDATTWLNGGGTIKGSTGKTAPIVGMQTLVNTVRAAGAKQILIVGGIKKAGTLRINDPNIMYTVHTYHKVALGDPTKWDAQWGSFKGNYPLFYGEWALLPNSSSAYRCTTATPTNANQKVINFLNYMNQNNINWIAWQFDNNYLILDHNTFTPTRLDDPKRPWTCNTPQAPVGMGTVVQQFTVSHFGISKPPKPA